MTPTKVCFRCGVEKPLTKFVRSNRRADGRTSRCLDCSRARNAARYGAAEKLQKRVRDLMRVYKLSYEDYRGMIDAQNGLCPIGNHPTDSWVVDHDHACCPGVNSCGKCVRGVICGPHNRALGFCHDDPAELRAAAEYLERTTMKNGSA